MKLLKISLTIFSFFTFAVILLHCTDDPITGDAQKLAALKKVTITFDSLVCEFGLPQGALSGKTFDELYAEDSATYANPANYSITLLLNMTADNTKDGADDAKFDGMTIDIVMDTITSFPVRTTADAFEVKKDTTLPVQAHGTINLETHRLTGLYIFRQTVDGNDLATTLSPSFNYKIGTEEGTINLPDIQQDIPTRASNETKAFLSGLLDSGIFNR